MTGTLIFAVLALKRDQRDIERLSSLLYRVYYADLVNITYVYT
jgi:vacuolar-type H+-ATPase subunit C/Vma6